MASYKDVLKLIREGKTLPEIHSLLPISPYHMKRILQSRRLRDALEADRMLAEEIARQRLALAQDHVIQRRLVIADADESETARKAAESIAQQFSRAAEAKASGQAKETPAVDLEKAKELDRKAKVKFLESLMPLDVVDRGLVNINRKTGQYMFEELADEDPLDSTEIYEEEHMAELKKCPHFLRCSRDRNAECPHRDECVYPSEENFRRYAKERPRREAKMAEYARKKREYFGLDETESEETPDDPLQ